MIGRQNDSPYEKTAVDKALGDRDPAPEPGPVFLLPESSNSVFHGSNFRASEILPRGPGVQHPSGTALKMVAEMSEQGPM